MQEIPPGWATDLAILELTGSLIEDRGDHLVVRSPRNPEYHWGNCLFVTDERTLNQAATWADRFHAAFPEATWIAIGLARMPDDQEAWTAAGLELESDEVLSTRTLPRPGSLPPGYTVHRLDGDEDWAQYTDLALTENTRSGEHEPQSYRRFTEQQVQIRRDLCDHDTAAFFGAFTAGRLVADLGIVRCGATARYQSVGTAQEHRGRGLAGHLLGVAARWAAAHGCDRWVIVTESTNPAGRVYRNAGFEPDALTATAYRAPLSASR